MIRIRLTAGPQFMISIKQENPGVMDAPTPRALVNVGFAGHSVWSNRSPQFNCRHCVCAKAATGNCSTAPTRNHWLFDQQGWDLVWQPSARGQTPHSLHGFLVSNDNGGVFWCWSASWWIEGIPTGQQHYLQQARWVFGNHEDSERWAWRGDSPIDLLTGWLVGWLAC